MNEKHTIQLKILGRSYPIRVGESEEEQLREVVSRINDLLEKYKERYGNKDNQDLLSMACMQFVGKLILLEKELQQNNVEEQINDIRENLDEFLKLNQI
ncbi:MAG: cell division protein ZapA [Bacteroidales bacterium]